MMGACLKTPKDQLKEATAYIMDYIDFYNHERLHSGIDYNLPAKYQRIAA